MKEGVKMDREIFSSMLTNENVHHFSKEERGEFISKSILKCGDCGKIKLTVLTEELAELIQEVTKIIRGKYKGVGLLEELADVLISIEYLKEICDISEDEIKFIDSEIISLQSSRWNNDK